MLSISRQTPCPWRTSWRQDEVRKALGSTCGWCCCSRSRGSSNAAHWQRGLGLEMWRGWSMVKWKAVKGWWFDGDFIEFSDGWLVGGSVPNSGMCANSLGMGAYHQQGPLRVTCDHKHAMIKAFSGGDKDSSGHSLHPAIEFHPWV